MGNDCGVHTLNYITEKVRGIPVKESCDVMVAGGGIAGISAALAAAREGAKVTLIEREYTLGGLATLGLIAIYLPLCDGKGRQVSFGIAEELLRLSIRYGTERREDTPAMKAWLSDKIDMDKRKKYRFEAQYNPHTFAIECEQMLVKLGVKIIYGTVAVAAETDNGKITHVVIENKSGRSAIAVKSVVDATGDADICKVSGAATELFEKGNSLASWYYYFKSGKVRLRLLGAIDDPNNPDQEGKLSDRKFSGVDGDELSEMTILAHAEMLKDIDSRRKDNPEYVPVCLPTIPQVRTTRRIVGIATSEIDDMHKRVESSIGMVGDWRNRGPVYELPFEVLYGKEVKNLITAGRCISSTDEMVEVTRVIPACAVTGQAAGIAAVMTDDFASLDVSELQKKLVASGVKLHEDELK